MRLASVVLCTLKCTFYWEFLLEMLTMFCYAIIVSMSYLVTCFDNSLFLSWRGRGNNLPWYYVSASWEITPGIVLLGLTKMQIYVMKKAAWNKWYLQRNDILHTLLFVYDAITYLTYKFIKNTSIHFSDMSLSKRNHLFS